MHRKKVFENILPMGYRTSSLETNDDWPGSYLDSEEGLYQFAKELISRQPKRDPEEAFRGAVNAYFDYHNGNSEDDEEDYIRYARRELGLDKVRESIAHSIPAQIDRVVETLGADSVNALRDLLHRMYKNQKKDFEYALATLEDFCDEQYGGLKRRMLSESDDCSRCEHNKSECVCDYENEKEWYGESTSLKETEEIIYEMRDLLDQGASGDDIEAILVEDYGYDLSEVDVIMEELF